VAGTELVAAPPVLERRAVRRWRRRRLVLGAGIVLALLAASLLARVAVGHGRTDVLAFDPSLAPSTRHLLGTDASGRDVLAAMVYATAPTLALALLAGVAATVVGTAAGLVAGYLRGPLDAIVRGLCDVLIAIPAFAMLVLVAAIMGRPSLVGVGLLIALFGWPSVARTVRAHTLTMRDAPFVAIGRLSNRSGAAIMAFELLPNMLALIAALLVSVVTGALAMAVGLGLVGLAPADARTLGTVLQDALTSGALSQGLWWCWVPPAATLIVFFVGLFLVSLAIDEVANPQLRSHG
jgi:peptide/nickel transport system permease protein